MSLQWLKNIHEDKTNTTEEQKNPLKRFSCRHFKGFRGGPSGTRILLVRDWKWTSVFLGRSLGRL